MSFGMEEGLLYGAAPYQFVLSPGPRESRRLSLQRIVPSVGWVQEQI